MDHSLKKYYGLSIIFLAVGAMFTVWSVFHTGHISALLDKLGNVLMVMGTIALGLTVGFQGHNKSSVESNTNKK